MAKKVQYIKIARIDQNGNDLTNTLESLTQITIPLTGAGNKTYKILTRADFPTYYLFQIDLNNSPDASSSPINSSTSLDYNFTGSLSTDLVTATTSPNFFTQVNSVKIPISQSISDGLNFYNSDSKNYNLNTYIQKDIFVKVTGSMNTAIIGGSTALRLGIYAIPPTRINNPDEGGNPYLLVSSSLFNASSPNPSQFELETSIPKENIEPGFSIQLRAIAGANITSCKLLSGSRLFITSSAATGPTLENIVEPYLSRKFINSDCDVLINNADQYQENPFLQDIDFSSGTIVPVNYDQIVTGTAQKATVPESMFTMGGMINPNNSAVNQVDKYNISASSYFGQTSGGTFVAYYKRSVTSGSPGVGYTTNFIVDYLITPDEEAVQIRASDESLDLLRRNFGSNANPLSAEFYPFGPLNGEVKLRAIPISGSETGSVLEYRGNTIVGTLGSVILVQSKTTGSQAPGDTGLGGGGIIYPASIELTSHADLPSKARQILTENNIIPPES